MISVIGGIFGVLINIVMFPIMIVCAIPAGILKAMRAKKSRLLFTGNEQSILAKAQQAIHMQENALLKPSRELLEVAVCIEAARCDYQIVKSRERFDPTFTEFLLPRINSCHISDRENVGKFFNLSI